ncbi:MAG TPA: hypothetical protein VG028_03220 [Terriglobia bacterium]|nr:hypothetical protein [Terriglobia bacterium]
MNDKYLQGMRIELSRPSTKNQQFTVQLNQNCRLESGGALMDQDAGPMEALNKLLKTATARGTLSWQSAAELLCDLREKGSGLTGQVSQQAQAVCQNAAELLRTSMEKAAREAGPEAYTAWLAAEAHWKNFQDAWTSKPLSWLRDPLISASGLVERLLAKGQEGGNAGYIRVLKEHGFNLGPLGRQILDRIRNDSFAVRDGRLGGYSNDFLREILGPNGTDELYRLAAVARAMGFAAEK